MRTLKKSLCLILALVFVLGLCTIGAGAAFTDAEEIQYPEAVSVMAGLGILKGYEDGSFGPEKTVTRAEAAKMIAYMVLGANAEKMPAGAAFNDVPATHWAAKYVNYCASKGIIAGYGNGKFGPSDPVTGVQLAKMLLVALGYDASKEFSDSNWDVVTVQLAIETGINADCDADFSVGASRDVCAQFVYNALRNVSKVAYSAITGLPYATGETFASSAAWNLQDVTGVLTENQATGSKYTVVNGVSYKFETGKELVGHVVRVLYKNSAADEKTTYAITDASTVIPAGTVKPTTVATAATVSKWSNYSAAGNAAPAEIVGGDGKAVNDLIVYKNEIVGIKTPDTFKIAKVVSINATTGAVTFDDSSVSNANWSVYAGIKLGDYVEISNVGALTTVIATTTETVFVSQRTEPSLFSTYHSYNNGAYSATKAVNNYITTPATIGGEVVFYLDHNGNYFMTAAPAAAVAKNYVYFVASYSKTVSNEYGIPSTSYYLQCVDTNGEVQQYLYGASAPTYDANIYELVPNYVTGTYTLGGVEAGTIYVPSETVFTGATKFANVPYFLTSDVKVISVLGSLGTLKVATAGKLAGTYTAGTVKALLTAIPGSSAKNVSVIFVTSEDATVAPDAEGGIVYIAAPNSVSSQVLVDGIGGTKVQQAARDFFVDGVYTSSVPVSNEGVLAAGFYTSTIAANGVYTLAPMAAEKNDSIVSGVDFSLYNGIMTGTYDGLDLSAYSFQNVNLFQQVDVSTAAAIEALIANGYTVTLKFQVKTVYGVTTPTGTIYVEAVAP